MTLNKKSLAALVLLILVIIQIQPFILHGDATTHEQIGSFTVQSTSLAKFENVSVYFPPGNSAPKAILQEYLSSLNIPLSNYGLLSSFSLKGAKVSQIFTELKSLEQQFGLKYYVSNSTVNAFPAYMPSSTYPYQLVDNVYTPSQIRDAYNFTYPLSHNITGKGTTIALVDAYGDPLIRYDVNAFDNLTGLPPTNLSIVYPGNLHPSGSNSSWAIETSTDVEWAHALAPGAKIILVIAPNSQVQSLDNAVSYVVSNHLANIVSLSWGIPETGKSGLGQQGVAAFSGVYKYAANNGISIMAATGDFGAYEQQANLTVNFPSSDPYVLAIGGTSLYPDHNHYTQTAWGGTLDGTSYGSGGGYSAFFNSPWWQVAPGFSSSSRGTPDVSMNANKNTGVIVISQAREYKIGGTSVASPMWADVISLMDQSLNRSVGFVNPLLYKISDSPLYSSSFYDITSGNNGYYNATPGWDAVTGLGTPKVASLLNATTSVLSPYGAIAAINGTGYNSTSVQAKLTIGGYPLNETYNGTTFYYLASYYNNQNFVKYGVAVNNTTLFRGYEVSQDGRIIKSFVPIGPYSVTEHTFDLSLSVNGTYVNYSTGATSGSLHLFLTNSGSSRMAFGAEQIGSPTNMTRIPYATFKDVSVIANNTTSVPVEVYETHYSGMPSSEYSTVQISSTSSTNFTVSYSNHPQDIIMGLYHGVIPQIIYNLTYAVNPTAAFSLIGNQFAGTVEWYLDGQHQTSSDITFTNGGIFNVTALYDSGKYSVTRFVNIPSMTQNSFTVSSNISYYQHPGFSLTSNYFYHSSGSGSITVTSMSGQNNFNIQSKGFVTYNRDLNGGSSTNVYLHAKNASLSIFVFPGNATVRVNSQVVKGTGGVHTVSVTPAETYINISSPGYFNDTYTADLYPGVNHSLQVFMKPFNASDLALVKGNVSDALYGFHLSGVNISVSKTGYTYTNSSGYFLMYLQPGAYNISFNRSLYQAKYLTLNLSKSESMKVSVSLVPQSVTSIPHISISAVFPVLFYFGYVSWTKYVGPSFAYYRIDIATNSNMISQRSVVVANQNTTFAFVNGIMPGHKYYLKVSIYLTDGEIYSSNTGTMSYSNPFVLLANIAIVAGILIYAGMAVRYVGRMRRKRGIKL